MDREVVIKQIKNRINVLENRPKDNARIVQKLRRQLRNIEKQAV